MMAKEQQAKDVEPHQINISAAEILAKVDEISGNAAFEDKVKIDEMYKYYVEVAFEELKNVHKQIVSNKIQEEKMSFKTD